MSDQKWYDPTTKRWYTRAELSELQRELYEELKDDGFKDIERLTTQGELDIRYLSQPNPTVSIYTALKVQERLPSDDYGHEESLLPADHEAFQYHDSPHARRYEKAAEEALGAILRREDWELCAAWALYAGGYSERSIHRILERSRTKVRTLLAPLKARLADIAP